MVNTSISKEKIVLKAQNYFDDGYACSQSILLSFAQHFELDLKTAKLISSTFGGGMGRLRETCGAVTGGFMVLGLAFGNENPKDLDTKLDGYRKVRDLNKRVVSIHGTSNCKSILKQHATQAQVKDRKHHKIICRQVVADAAANTYDILKENHKI